MTEHEIRCRFEVRRKGDVEELADRLVGLFEERTGLTYFGTPVTSARKRGGTIVFGRKTKTLAEPLAAIRILAEDIEANAWFVERIDQFMFSVTNEDGLVGFSQGDFSGWVRDQILEDLREGTS